MYRNEAPCGRAINNSGIDRSQLFFTTKIPPESMGYDRTRRAIDSSLKKAEQDHFDLYVGMSYPAHDRCVVHAYILMPL